MAGAGDVASRLGLREWNVLGQIFGEDLNGDIFGGFSLGLDEDLADLALGLADVLVGIADRR
jgi:hypothetical protein